MISPKYCFQTSKEIMIKELGPIFHEYRELFSYEYRELKKSDITKRLGIALEITEARKNIYISERISITQIVYKLEKRKTVCGRSAQTTKKWKKQTENWSFREGNVKGPLEHSILNRRFWEDGTKRRKSLPCTEWLILFE